MQQSLASREPREPEMLETKKSQKHFGETVSLYHPKNLFGLILTSKGYFKISGYLKLPQKMHSKTKGNCPFSGLFFDFRVILTSGGYLLKLALKVSLYHPGPEKGVITKGVFSLEKSLESLKSLKFSRISRKWSDSPLFYTVWLFSRISRISKFSRISRKWTFLKRPLFQKTPFSEPEPSWPKLLQNNSLQGKEKRIPVPAPPPFSKKAMRWGKNGRYQWICLFSL